MKATFFLPLFALAAQFALAAMPPACLLHAVNTQDNPADLSDVCGNNATKVQSAIASLCTGDNASIAQSAFIATCSSAGKKVASYTATATATGASRSGTYVYTTAVYNSSCSCTQTIVTSVDAASATGRITSGTAASRTGSAGATSSAGAVPAQQKVGGYAAAAIALVGAVAAL